MPYMNSPKEPSSGGFLYKLLVVAPALLFSLFIGGAGLSLIAGSFVPDRKKTEPAAAAVANATAPAPAPPATQPVPAVGSSTPDAAAPATGGDVMAQGQQVYMMTCVACHQATGMGLPNIFPPLGGSDWAQTDKPERIIAIVLHGLQGPVVINGQPFNTPMAMAPLGPMLKDDQIAAALTYVRASFGNKAGPIIPAQVASVRERTKSRTTMWTVPELDKELPP